jgi:hypothetical protein
MLAPLIHPSILHHGLHVEDRRAVNCLERENAQPRRRLDRTDGHSMEADGVRTIGGAGGEHTGQRDVWISPRVSLQDASIGSVKPGEENQILPGCHAM